MSWEEGGRSTRKGRPERGAGGSCAHARACMMTRAKKHKCRTGRSSGWEPSNRLLLLLPGIRRHPFSVVTAHKPFACRSFLRSLPLPPGALVSLVSLSNLSRIYPSREGSSTKKMPNSASVLPSARLLPHLPLELWPTSFQWNVKQRRRRSLWHC